MFDVYFDVIQQVGQGHFEYETVDVPVVLPHAEYVYAEARAVAIKLYEALGEDYPEYLSFAVALISQTKSSKGTVQWGANFGVVDPVTPVITGIFATIIAHLFGEQVGRRAENIIIGLFERFLSSGLSTWIILAVVFIAVFKAYFLYLTERYRIRTNAETEQRNAETEQRRIERETEMMRLMHGLVQRAAPPPAAPPPVLLLEQHENRLSDDVPLDGNLGPSQNQPEDEMQAVLPSLDNFIMPTGAEQTAIYDEDEENYSFVGPDGFRYLAVKKLDGFIRTEESTRLVCFYIPGSDRLSPGTT